MLLVRPWDAAPQRQGVEVFSQLKIDQAKVFLTVTCNCQNVNNGKCQSETCLQLFPSFKSPISYCFLVKHYLLGKIILKTIVVATNKYWELSPQTFVYSKSFKFQFPISEGVVVLL